MATIGDNIKLVRQAKGKSQADLAKAIGSTKSTISKYELGRREPSFSTIQHIAGALGVSPLQLFDTENFSVAAPDISAAPLEAVAEELNVPLELVREILQSTDPAADDAKLKIAYVRNRLTNELSSPMLGRISSAFYQLNRAGQEKAVERVEELTEIPKYRWDVTPDALPEDK